MFTDNMVWAVYYSILFILDCGRIGELQVQLESTSYQTGLTKILKVNTYYVGRYIFFVEVRCTQY